MSYLVCQRHESPEASDKDLIRHIREQGIAVCVSQIGQKMASIVIRAPALIKSLRAELVASWM